jgi:hypothetical protein
MELHLMELHAEMPTSVGHVGEPGVDPGCCWPTRKEASGGVLYRVGGRRLRTEEEKVWIGEARRGNREGARSARLAKMKSWRYPK